MRILLLILAISLLITSDVYARSQDEDLEQFRATGNCPECDLSEADLSQIVVKGSVNLESANLCQAYFGSNFSLIGAKMSKADLRDTFLLTANLSYVDLSNANLDNAILIGANLSNATLTGAMISNAAIENANLSNAIWTDGQHKCREGSIGRCILDVRWGALY